jgi:hypothetical protein
LGVVALLGGPEVQRAGLPSRKKMMMMMGFYYDTKINKKKFLLACNLRGKSLPKGQSEENSVELISN